MEKLLGYNELFEILNTQCYFAKDVYRFQKKYEDNIKMLSFKDQGLLEDSMEIFIDCDNYCV